MPEIFASSVLARPAYYDRAPVPIFNSHNVGGVAGGFGLTNRWTYTVPAGKAAWVEFIFVQVIRQSAAGAVGGMQSIVQLDDAINPIQLLLHAFIITNGVGDRAQEQASPVCYLQAGDQLLGQTADGSTGGTGYHVNVGKIIEFTL